MAFPTTMVPDRGCGAPGAQSDRGPGGCAAGATAAELKQAAVDTGAPERHGARPRRAVGAPRPPMWRRYLCWVQYRGEAFCGWQAQPGSLSAQAALGDGLARVFGSGGFTKPVVASRTDAGVHAVANVSPSDG